MIFIHPRSFFPIFLTLICVIHTPSLSVADESSPAGQRIISIGGSVTEIVYALEQERRLIARDTTSLYPETVKELPDVGYMRRLSPEGVLSVEPDLIIAETGSGPQETIDVLKQASVKFIEIPDGHDREAIKNKIMAVAQALGVEKRGTELAKTVDAELLSASQEAAKYEGEPKRVLFILSANNDRIMAAGSGTSADGIIRMAGGVNAMSDFNGFKLVSDEAITVAAPDVILMMARQPGSDHSKRAEALFALPAMATTPAAESQNLIQMNGLLLLGFGPRTAEAVKQLNSALYGKEQ